jgi:hypothetical protein
MTLGSAVSVPKKERGVTPRELRRSRGQDDIQRRPEGHVQREPIGGNRATRDRASPGQARRSKRRLRAARALRARARGRRHHGRRRPRGPKSLTVGSASNRPRTGTCSGIAAAMLPGTRPYDHSCRVRHCCRPPGIQVLRSRELAFVAHGRRVVGGAPSLAASARDRHLCGSPPRPIAF